MSCVNQEDPATMSNHRNRLKFKFPLFAEGEAEGLYAITVLAAVLVVVIVAIAMR